MERGCWCVAPAEERGGGTMGASDTGGLSDVPNEDSGAKTCSRKPELLSTTGAAGFLKKLRSIVICGSSKPTLGAETDGTVTAVASVGIGVTGGKDGGGGGGLDAGAEAMAILGGGLGGTIELGGVGAARPAMTLFFETSESPASNSWTASLNSSLWNGLRKIDFNPAATKCSRFSSLSASSKRREQCLRIF